jgi:hypothetical protein
MPVAKSNFVGGCGHNNDAFDAFPRCQPGRWPLRMYDGDGTQELVTVGLELGLFNLICSSS